MRRLCGHQCARWFLTHKEIWMDQQRVLITGGAGFLGINLARHLLSRGYAIASFDVEGIRNVLDASLRHGVKRFVHVSSTAVYGIPDHHPLYETDRLEGVGPYGQAKIQAELICLEYRARGMTVPIIRPKSFVGPERLGVFALLYDWAYTGHNFPMIGSGDNRYQLLDVEDLCDAI